MPPRGEEEERCKAQPEMCQTGVFFSVKAVVLALIHQPLIFADISRMFADVGVLQEGHSGETTADRSG